MMTIEEFLERADREGIFNVVEDNLEDVEIVIDYQRDLKDVPSEIIDEEHLYEWVEGLPETQDLLNDEVFDLAFYAVQKEVGYKGADEILQEEDGLFDCLVSDIMGNGYVYIHIVNIPKKNLNKSLTNL